MIPSTAKPHEVGILILRLLLDVRNPREIARTMHYRSTRPVEKTLKKYRQVIQTFYVSRDAVR